MTLAFPKPSQIKRPTEAVCVYPSGREVCTKTKAGRAEYQRRRRVAWANQNGLCAICYRHFSLDLTVSDHIEPRGMGGGRRDDRQENIQATCWTCNNEKGSKR